jgi:hypothetical protein
VKTGCRQRGVKRIVAMHVIKREKLLILLVPHARINKHQSIFVLNKQTAHGPGAHIVLIGRIFWLPERFRNNAKHGSSIEFKVTGIDWKQLHTYLNKTTRCQESPNITNLCSQNACKACKWPNTKLNFGQNMGS